MKLVKVFRSNSKPKLFQPEVGGKLIWKVGDNLITDFSVLTIANYMNSVWRGSKLPISVETYRVFPCGTLQGFIEYVPNVESVKTFKFETLQCDDKFISSLVGSCLLGWVLGIRDRHEDNQLIITLSPLAHRFLSIDFSFLFNVGPLIDAPRFSIHNGIIEKLNETNQTEKFLALAVSGFESLFDKKNQLYALGNTFFPNNFIRYFNSAESYFEFDKDTAKKAIRKKLEEKLAKKSVKHKLKDVAHFIKTSF